MTEQWDVEKSIELYNIERWGDGHFSANEQGELIIIPNRKKKENAISITKVIDEIKDHKIKFPVVLRFHDILREQVIQLNQTFQKVIKKAGFTGNYIGVYPIKVNQMREVIEEVVDVGTPYNYGLEAGSKPELLSALALNTNKNALTILNGFKDKDYLRLGLLGRKLNKKVIVVIEKFSELQELLELSEEMNVDPMIGFRVKLSTQGSGKWSKSSGEKAKFGLTMAEVLKAIKVLKQHKKTSYAKLFHFHIGSQITDIRTIKDAITEGARIFAGMVKLGLPLEYIDVGGGLGIDYDGSKSTVDSSINYTLKDYVEDVVYIIQQICDLEEIAHPNIITESGRAISARHSFVVFKVFDRIKTLDMEFNTDEIVNEHILVSNFRELWEELTPKNIHEAYNDACQFKTECASAFKLGVLSITERAIVETLFWKICHKIREFMDDLDFIPDELQELDNYLAQQYLGNFSIFQSVPDLWAIDQLFPVVPLTRLNEQPTVISSLADITCDSDGKIDKFIGPEDVNTTIPLHRLKKGEDYYLGIFLTGAYQDVMGDMHNLFGKLNEIHLFTDDDDESKFYIEEIIPGNTAEDVLRTMQYNPEAMASFIKKSLTREIQFGNIPAKEGVWLSDFYEKCLKSYTYLDK